MKGASGRWGTRTAYEPMPRISTADDPAGAASSPSLNPSSCSPSSSRSPHGAGLAAAGGPARASPPPGSSAARAPVPAARATRSSRAPGHSRRSRPWHRRARSYAASTARSTPARRRRSSGVRGGAAGLGARRPTPRAPHGRGAGVGAMSFAGCLPSRTLSPVRCAGMHSFVILSVSSLPSHCPGVTCFGIQESSSRPGFARTGTGERGVDPHPSGPQILRIHDGGLR